MLKKIILLLIVFCISAAIQSCGKKEEEQTFIPPPQETTVDKEREQKEREEFERLKNLEGKTDSAIAADSLSKADSLAKSGSDSKKFVQKEKELNKRLDNPKVTVTDYIEFLQRGTSGGGNFEQNMKKADALWETGNLDRFTANYKSTKKLIVLNEPKVVSQSGNEAVVEVTLKKIDNKNNKDEEFEMVVKYNLVADSKGKWKIKSNTVIKK